MIFFTKFSTICIFVTFPFYVVNYLYSILIIHKCSSMFQWTNLQNSRPAPILALPQKTTHQVMQPRASHIPLCCIGGYIDLNRREGNTLKSATEEECAPLFWTHPRDHDRVCQSRGGSRLFWLHAFILNYYISAFLSAISTSHIFLLRIAHISGSFIFQAMRPTLILANEATNSSSNKCKCLNVSRISQSL